MNNDELCGDDELTAELAAFDAWLEAHRVVLAAERDVFASLPLPAAADDEATRLQRQFECDLGRQAIDNRLRHMGEVVEQRAKLVARLKASSKRCQERQQIGF